MTYTEVKAKYTTIESIDNRFKEIKNIEKIGEERYRAASVTYLNEVNEVLKKFNVTDYHCHRANSRNITFLQEENNIFYEIDICAAYEYNWNKIQFCLCTDHFYVRAWNLPRFFDTTQKCLLFFHSLSFFSKSLNSPQI